MAFCIHCADQIYLPMHSEPLLADCSWIRSIKGHVWSGMTWMQWLTAVKSVGSESEPIEKSVAKTTLGLQSPATHICPALPWAHGPSTFWDMLLLLTQAAAFQMVPPMLWPRAMWSQISSSNTTNFSHETLDIENMKWIFGQYLL